MLILLNIYAYLGFNSFSKKFKTEVLGPDGEFFDELLCDTPYHCFISLLLYGLRDDNGIGAFGYNMSIMNSNYDFYTNFLFEFSFFLIIT